MRTEELHYKMYTHLLDFISFFFLLINLVFGAVISGCLHCYLDLTYTVESIVV